MLLLYFSDYIVERYTGWILCYLLKIIVPNFTLKLEMLTNWSRYLKMLSRFFCIIQIILLKHTRVNIMLFIENNCLEFYSDMR